MAALRERPEIQRAEELRAYVIYCRTFNATRKVDSIVRSVYQLAHVTHWITFRVNVKSADKFTPPPHAPNKGA